MIADDWPHVRQKDICRYNRKPDLDQELVFPKEHIPESGIAFHSIKQ